MNEKLSGEYLADFNEVTKYLKKYAAKGEKLNEVLDDLSELYSDLEAEGAPLSSVHEGSAEDYAKELLENLPKKKTFFTTKRFVLIFACAVLVAGICFYSNSPLKRMNSGINYVANHLDDFSFDDTSTTAYIIGIWDGGISLESEENIELKDHSLFREGEIFFEGTAYSFYKDSNQGSIIVPSVHAPVFWSNPKNFIEKISDYDENSFRTIGNMDTGCGIYMSHPDRFGTEILYRGKPAYYKINPDGSVDFKFVFEKTESPYNEKSISELAEEGTELTLVLDCLHIKWEYKDSLSSENS